MSIITITKDNFEAEIVGAAKPVLVDFWLAFPNNFAVFRVAWRVGNKSLRGSAVNFIFPWRSRYCAYGDGPSCFHDRA